MPFLVALRFECLIEGDSSSLVKQLLSKRCRACEVSLGAHVAQAEAQSCARCYGELLAGPVHVNPRDAVACVASNACSSS